MKSKQPIKFRAQPGSRLSQKDVNVIGPELLRLAETLKVDLPQLTARQVQHALEADRTNVLWRYIDASPKKALDHWIQRQIGDLIRHVRYDRVDIPDIKPQALFEYVKDTSLAGKGTAEPGRVSAIAARDKIGIATRIADKKVSEARQAVQSLHDWVRSANVPTRYAKLAKALMAVFEEFRAN